MKKEILRKEFLENFKNKEIINNKDLFDDLLNEISFRIKTKDDIYDLLDADEIIIEQGGEPYDGLITGCDDETKHTYKRIIENTIDAADDENVALEINYKKQNGEKIAEFVFMGIDKGVITFRQYGDATGIYIIEFVSKGE